MVIAPELDNIELKGEGNFYLCPFCSQVITKEKRESYLVCPNCETPIYKFLAIKDTTAKWWYHNTKGWFKKEIVKEIQKI